MLAARIRIAAERYAVAAFFGGAALVAYGIYTWNELTRRDPLPLCILVVGMSGMIAGLSLTLARQPLDGDLPRLQRTPGGDARIAPWQGGRILLQVGAGFVLGIELLAFGQSTSKSMALLSKGMATMGGVIAACFGIVAALTVLYSQRGWRHLVRRLRDRAFAVGTVESGDLLVDVTYFRKSAKQTTVSYVDGMRQESTSTAHWLEGRPRTSSGELVVRVADGSRVTIRALHWMAPIRFQPLDDSSSAAMRTVARIAPGDEVIAVAHAADDARPIVFGAPTDPRLAIRWVVLGWTALWWLLVAVSITCGVVAATA